MSLLLGAPDRRIEEKETTTWETNKIGGSPDWFKDTAPLPLCTRCQREMMLVTQIYCPLTASPYHRCLHIFVCPVKACSGCRQGWRVIRTQQLDEAMTSEKGGDSAMDSQQADDWGVGQDDWGVGQDDWGVGQDDWGEADDGETPQLAIVADSAASHLSRMNIDDNLPITDSSGQTASFTPAPPHTNSGAGGARSLGDLGDRSLGNLGDASSGDVGDKSSRTLLVRSSPDPEPSSEEEKLSGSRVSSVSDGDADGFEASEDVQVEGIALDDEGLQRMMGLLAPQGRCGKSREGSSQVMETPQKAAAAFPAYYLEVFAESEVEDEMSDHVSCLLSDYQQREGKQFAALLDECRRGQTKADTEGYDKTEVKHGDKQCYKFIKRLQLYPQQCIRYQWNGSPLLIAKASGALTTERCGRCGSQRGFELQLVPPLIPLLRLPGERESTVEFGTVLVFTCLQSCWEEGERWREETVLLQHDPDHHRFK